MKPFVCNIDFLKMFSVILLLLIYFRLHLTKYCMSVGK